MRLRTKTPRERNPQLLQYHSGLNAVSVCRGSDSAGLMPTEARGNYLPEAPYLCETKTYLNYMHASESTLDSGTSGRTCASEVTTLWRYTNLFIIMSNYLTTDGLKIFSLLPEAPLRPEARGICHICHMVNPALQRYHIDDDSGVATASSSESGSMSCGVLLVVVVVCSVVFSV